MSSPIENIQLLRNKALYNIIDGAEQFLVELLEDFSKCFFFILLIPFFFKKTHNIRINSILH